MFPRLFRRRRRALERITEAIPQTALSDIFADFTARSGVDLGDAAEQVLGRLGEAVMLAETSAGMLGDPETARQLREMAARAAGRAAELAYRTGAERLVGRRRRSHRGLLLIGLAAGVAAGGALAYLLVSRSTQTRLPPGAAENGTPEPGTGGQAVVVRGPMSVAPAGSPVQQAIDGLRLRVQAAMRAARDTQAESERRLWREYRSGGPPTDA